jgi:hypothetical protein
MKHQPEFILQCQVCEYLRTAWPKVLFLSDSIAAVKLTMPQAARNKKVQKQGFKCPDLIILEPRGGYFGLFIELKVESPYKLNGEIKASKDDHLKLQQETLARLNDLGYKAFFAWSFDHAKQIIDNYMKNY